MTTRVSVPDDGGEVTVPTGEVLEIALPETASTGYRWELDALPPGSELVDDRVEATARPGPPGTAPAAGARAPKRVTPVPVGGAATRVFAVRPGRSGTVSAKLRRVWESAEPLRTFSVRVSAD